jgi:hypothetical protein
MLKMHKALALYRGKYAENTGKKSFPPAHHSRISLDSHDIAVLLLGRFLINFNRGGAEERGAL